MLITKRSPLTGQMNTMDIPVTPGQIEKWKQGTLIQNAMPNLTPPQREFLMTGYTPEDWEKIFPKCPSCGESLEEPDACGECNWRREVE